MGDPLELKMFEASGWNYETEKSKFRSPLNEALERGDGDLSSEFNELLDSVIAVLTPQQKHRSYTIKSNHSNSIQMVRSSLVTFITFICTFVQVL